MLKFLMILLKELKWKCNLYVINDPNKLLDWLIQMNDFYWKICNYHRFCNNNNIVNDVMIYWTNILERFERVYLNLIKMKKMFRS